MTSNIGSQIIQDNMDKVNDLNRDKQLNKIREQVFELLKKSIRPEFLNRVDEIIMFEPLTKDEITRVVELQLAAVQQMLAKNDISLTATKQAINLISALGFDPHYGARPIKRVLQKLVLNTLSKMILEGKVDKDSDIVMDEKEGALTFTNRQPAENKTH